MEKIWETPSFDEDTTPEEALGLIGEFERDTHNLAGHPYNNREHKQHADVLAYRDKLYSRAYPAESGEEDEEEDEDEQQAEEHSALVEQAQEEMDALHELGFRRDAIPDDVQEYHVSALREQRLLAEGNYAELGSMLERDLTSLERSGSMPPGKISAVRELIHVEGVDPALKGQVDAIANDIIALIYEAKKRSRK